MGRQVVDYYVLDAVADDVESVPHIRDRVAGWDAAAVAQLLPSLKRLTEERLIHACLYHPTDPALVDAGEGVWPDCRLEDMWFRITPHGLMVHSAWEPDPLAGTA